MKAPKLITWLVSILIGIFAVLLKFKFIAVLGLPFALNPFWVLFAALAILVLATLVPGL